MFLDLFTPFAILDNSIFHSKETEQVNFACSEITEMIEDDDIMPYVHLTHSTYPFEHDN